MSCSLQRHSLLLVLKLFVLKQMVWLCLKAGLFNVPCTAHSLVARTNISCSLLGMNGTLLSIKVKSLDFSFLAFHFVIAYSDKAEGCLGERCYLRDCVCE